MTTLSHLIAELRRLHQKASAGPLHGAFDFYINEEWQALARVALRTVHEGQATLKKYAIDVDDEHVRVRTVANDDALLHAIALLRNLAPNLAEMLETAERALSRAEQFISNGVEFGYIRMPDAATPDPAHETLPLIRAALAELERLAGP